MKFCVIICLNFFLERETISSVGWVSINSFQDCIACILIEFVPYLTVSVLGRKSLLSKAALVPRSYWSLARVKLPLKEEGNLSLRKSCIRSNCSIVT